MSSIIRARSGLTRWSERLEGIAGSSLEPKVAGPSMLGIGCPDRHPLLRVTSPKTHPPRRAPLPRERVRSVPLSGPSPPPNVVGNARSEVIRFASRFGQQNLCNGHFPVATRRRGENPGLVANLG